MASDTRNVKLGVCRITFGGVDLGYTKGGVEVEVTTQTHQVTVDQFGESIVNEIIMGRNVTATVPLAETTLENMVKIMPGAELVGDAGTKASATVTFSTAAPVNGDKVTIAGVDFTFRTNPIGIADMAIPATIAAAAQALADAVNNSSVPVSATVNAAVVTLTAAAAGTAGNAITLSKTATTSANITTSGATFAGGVAGGQLKVKVPSGVGLSLLNYAQKMVLHPIANAANDKSEDFVILKAATAGALTFAYRVDEERVFNCTFNGYPDINTGDLFVFGDEIAA